MGNRRLRWYDASFDVAGFKRLADAMLRHEYRATTGWGFRVSQRRKDWIAGSYFERFERADTVTDPLGASKEYMRVDFRTIEFVMSSKFPRIELHNPQRGAGDLFVRVAEFLDFGVAIAPLDVDVTRWCEALRRRTSGEIVGLEVSDVAITAAVSGVIGVEGISDVRSALAQLVGRRAHRVSRAMIRWHEGAADMSCDVAASGRAIITGGSASTIPILRESLTEACGETGPAV